MNEQQARGPVPTAPSGTSSGTGPAAGGTRPVPAPPRAQAVAERAAHLPDHAARLEDLADPLTLTLARHLRARGVSVDVDYRGQLPIVAQYQGKAVVAESDSDTVRDTLRETLRLRPQVLRRLGWHYIRVHAFDLYSDPAGVAERIAAILGVAPEGGAVDTVTQPIDVLD